MILLHSLSSFVSYAHLDGHENFEDVPSKYKRSSDDADTDNTAGPSVARPDRRHKTSELSTEFELEGAITATDMTSASEKNHRSYIYNGVQSIA